MSWLISQITVFITILDKSVHIVLSMWGRLCRILLGSTRQQNQALNKISVWLTSVFDSSPLDLFKQSQMCPNCSRHFSTRWLAMTWFNVTYWVTSTQDLLRTISPSVTHSNAQIHWINKQSHCAVSRCVWNLFYWSWQVEGWSQSRGKNMTNIRKFSVLHLLK